MEIEIKLMAPQSSQHLSEAAQSIRFSYVLCNVRSTVHIYRKAVGEFISLIWRSVAAVAQDENNRQK